MSIVGPGLHSVTLKIASRCNLNCSYCYEYNRGDSTWRGTAPLMTFDTFSKVVDRILEHCVDRELKQFSIVLHGGEPCLMPLDRLRQFLEHSRNRLLEESIKPTFVMQTNGTLLSPGHASLLREYNVRVGISLDGPRSMNDAFRLDKRGRSSYDPVVRGIECLRAEDVPFAILSVINPSDGDPIAVHEHFMELGADAVNYLFPDYTHDDFPEHFRQSQPVARNLIRLFDHLWLKGSGVEALRVQPFFTVMKLILGGAGNSDFFGSEALGFIFVNASGQVETLDVAKVCENGATYTGLDVLRNSFSDLYSSNAPLTRLITHSRPVPSQCKGCVEESTCSGGYAPHRWSSSTGLDNKSCWCADIKMIFEHLRERLDVPPEESKIRRQVLSEMSEVHHA